MLQHPLARNPSSSTSGEGSTSNAGSGIGNSGGSGGNNGLVGNNGIVQGDNGEGFEFTKRKKWPQLLLTELVGSAVFCLVPTGASNGYKIIYSSPASAEMIGYKSEELEGRDMTELLYGVDKQPFLSLLSQIATPSPRNSVSRDPSTSTSDSSTPDAPSPSSKAGVPRGESVTAFFRLVGRDSVPRVWEFRAHGYFGDQQSSQAINSPEPNGGFDGGGIMGSAMGQPQLQQQSDPSAVKAIWLMGRKAGGSTSRDEDANGKTLDAFLDLKLENERLREELKELQAEMSDDDDYGSRRGNNSVPQSPRITSDTYNQMYPQEASDSGSESDSDSDGGASGSSAGANDAYQSKIQQSSSSALPGTGPRGAKRKSETKPKKARPPKPILGMIQSGPPAKVEEGMHVCVTCGRTDSPEWRKGPLGPKTLCNACGLRWAKRNSTAPTRRERKPAGETKKAQAAAAAAQAQAQANAQAQAHSQLHSHHGHGHP